jgi:hypothetical protein
MSEGRKNRITGNKNVTLLTYLLRSKPFSRKAVSMLTSGVHLQQCYPESFGEDKGGEVLSCKHKHKEIKKTNIPIEV